MMKKMAIFTEGYTELAFAEKLVLAVAEKNSIAIECREIRGGTSTTKTVSLVRSVDAQNESEFFVLIYDCGGDNAVKSRMRAEYDSLAKSGYSFITCIRDLYPDFEFSEVGRLEANLPLYVRTKPIKVLFILAIMEIESWFLSENSHFAKIDSLITVESIKSLGFNPATDDMERRAEPAKDLNACYQLAGKAYGKTKTNIDRTIAALDMPKMFLETSNQIKYLKQFCDSISNFLTTT